LDPATITENLYSGTPGIVIFFLECFYSTGDGHYRDIARKGADQLLSVYTKRQETAFYEGLAGTGFALEEAYKATGEGKYRKAVLDILEMLAEKAVRKGRGIAWSEITDIVSGDAGTGLFLLYAARELREARWIDLACAAGRRLIELGIPEHGGLKWAMSPTFPRVMPNFSHGTAGISYFLARLHEVTKKEEFLEAARAGVRYLSKIAQKDTCFLFHDEPDNKDLYYLGWCQGPVGTARLFIEMDRLTGERSGMAWIKRSSRAVMESGIPEKQTPGLWNNVGICCGLAGIADYFLELAKMTGEPSYRDFAWKLAANVLCRATKEKGGLKWIHADMRRDPDVVFAQTGLMQGASGIGLFFLHADAAATGRPRRIIFPDEPFGR
jgi:lantibiotic modifying enzyme